MQSSTLKLEIHFLFFFDFFGFGGTIADLSLVTTAFLVLLL